MIVDIGAAQKADQELIEYTIANFCHRKPLNTFLTASLCYIASYAFDIWTAGIALMGICNPSWLEKLLPARTDIGETPQAHQLF
jgi:hypothetical protein